MDEEEVLPPPPPLLEELTKFIRVACERLNDEDLNDHITIMFTAHGMPISGDMHLTCVISGFANSTSISASSIRPEDALDEFIRRMIFERNNKPLQITRVKRG